MRNPKCLIDGADLIDSCGLKAVSIVSPNSEVVCGPEGYFP